MDNKIRGYLFAYFTGESEEGEQVYFAVSEDGFRWQDLNGGKPVLYSSIGEKGVRDPFILYSVVDGCYYIIATDLRIASGKGWDAAVTDGSTNIIIWKSEDLIQWSEPWAVPMKVADAGCVWAPEAVYDPEKDAYLVFWASKVREPGEAAGKHRIYCSYTKDFVEFSKPEKYIERAHDVIDTTIIRDGDMFYRFSKDETVKNICVDRGRHLRGEFEMIPANELKEMMGVEGPTVFPLAQPGTWCLMVDQFAEEKGYLPLVCSDLSGGTFRVLSPDAYDMGKNRKRHGSVLVLHETEYEKIMKKWGNRKVTSLNQVEITDDFWKREIDLVRNVVVPYQWEALNDRIADAQPSYCMHNFRTAAKLNRERKRNKDFVQPTNTTNGFCVWPENPDAPEEKFYGFVFQDSDFAKWVEAASYILMQYSDPELEKTVDQAIDLVCEAQMEDGYLDTFYIINDITKRFTNLRDHHELYCFGHLAEGAVAYYQATGKDKLLRAACRYADCIAEHFGPEEGKIHGYPGHEIAEMALARLYEATGEKKYLDLGAYFINERGKRPYYFDREEPPKAGDEEKLRYQYHQAHLPVREQQEAVGHAVRAVYLYSGMADFARLTGDTSLKEACERLWDDIVQRKMYITGGIGATHIGEAFSFAYDLPNDTAYAETCASIGMIFFARRMLLMDADSRYGDIMERELYNIVLSGMDLNGTGFFYVNPLEVFPKACHEDERKEHVKPVRQKWFGCACCPPNLARLISSIGSYIVTAADTCEENETIYVHLYIGCDFTTETPDGEVTVQIRSGFPWDGKVRIRVKAEQEQTLTVALRIPGWCDDYRINGVEDAVVREEKGYLYITGEWKDDTVVLEFPMEVRLLEADTRVREDIGKAAVMRGPVVYCLEEADNGENLHLLQIDPTADYKIVTEQIAGETVRGIKAMGWRQKERESRELYRPYRPVQYERVEIKWIPYYSWANRGEGEMQVWTKIFHGGSF